jgi:hypothetical protein
MLGPFEGLTYVVRSQAVLMPLVAAAVMRRGAPFQAAQPRREGDVGEGDVTGRRGPSVVAS